MFLINSNNTITSSLLKALFLVLTISLGIIMTFIVSKILSKTLLKGQPSSFTLELPPYRKPKILKVIVRSILDRTIFVLGRAVTVAIPAGLIIYILANTSINSNNLLTIISNYLNPLATLIGLDGVILLAFILGFPANEIVIPIIMMIYTSTGIMNNYESLSSLKELLINNGWTTLTAVCTIIFSLLHFPCSTTVLTIHKETKSLKWTLLSVLIPTLCGIITCLIVTTLYRIIM
jgi:ferrous iron transport protein B